MTNHHDRSQPTHVVLVGLPFCGKTLIGQRLARQLRRPFFDSDTAVSVSAHRAGAGEVDHEEVNDQERTWFDDLVHLTAPSVIAAPASVLDRPATWSSDDTWVVWLDTPTETVFARLREEADAGDVEARVAAVDRSATGRRARAAEIADHRIDLTADDEADLSAQRIADAFADRFPAPAAPTSGD